MSLVPASSQLGMVTAASTALQCFGVDTGDTLFAHEFDADPETVALASLEQSSQHLMALSRALGIAPAETASPIGRTIVTEVA